MSAERSNMAKLTKARKEALLILFKCNSTDVRSALCTTTTSSDIGERTINTTAAQALARLGLATIFPSQLHDGSFIALTTEGLTTAAKLKNK